KVFFMFEFAKKTSKVASQAGFLGNDQSFGHEKGAIEAQLRLNCKLLKARPGRDAGSEGLSQFYEVFAGQLFNQPFQFQTQKNGRDRRTRQIASSRDGIDGRFTRFNRVIDGALRLR